MGKFTGVLLASDFDNTIVDTASSFRGGQDMPAPSAKTLEALRYFMENGGAFTVATGRARSAVWWASMWQRSCSVRTDTSADGS